MRCGPLPPQWGLSRPTPGKGAILHARRLGIALTPVQAPCCPAKLRKPSRRGGRAVDGLFHWSFKAFMPSTQLCPLSCFTRLGSLIPSTCGCAGNYGTLGLAPVKRARTGTAPSPDPAPSEAVHVVSPSPVVSAPCSEGQSERQVLDLVTAPGWRTYPALGPGSPFRPQPHRARPRLRGAA